MADTTPVDTNEMFDLLLLDVQRIRAEVTGQGALTDDEIAGSRAAWGDLVKDLAPWSLNNRTVLMSYLTQIFSGSPNFACNLVPEFIRISWETQKTITAVVSSMSGDDLIRRAAFNQTKQRISLEIEAYLDSHGVQDPPEMVQDIEALVMNLQYQQ